MTQDIKCLSDKQEDMSLISRVHLKNLGAVEHVCNPRTGEIEKSWSLGIP